MPEIPSIGHGSVGPINRAAGLPADQAEPKAQELNGRAGDRVELSLRARMLDRLRQLPEVRADLVAAVKGAIASGTYETPERIEIAAERLLEDLRV
jgi:hypothetical protein